MNGVGSRRHHVVILALAAVLATARGQQSETIHCDAPVSITVDPAVADGEHVARYNFTVPYYGEFTFNTCRSNCSTELTILAQHFTGHSGCGAADAGLQLQTMAANLSVGLLVPIELARGAGAPPALCSLEFTVCCQLRQQLQPPSSQPEIALNTDPPPPATPSPLITWPPSASSDDTDGGGGGGGGSSSESGSDTTSNGSEMVIVAISLAVLFGLVFLGLVLQRSKSPPPPPTRDGDATRGGGTVRNPTYNVGTRGLAPVLNLTDTSAATETEDGYELAADNGSVFYVAIDDGTEGNPSSTSYGLAHLHAAPAATAYAAYVAAVHSPQGGYGMANAAPAPILTSVMFQPPQGGYGMANTEPAPVLTLAYNQPMRPNQPGFQQLLLPSGAYNTRDTEDIGNAWVSDPARVQAESGAAVRQAGYANTIRLSNSNKAGGNPAAADAVEYDVVDPPSQTSAPPGGDIAYDTVDPTPAVEYGVVVPASQTPATPGGDVTYETVDPTPVVVPLQSRHATYGHGPNGTSYIASTPLFSAGSTLVTVAPQAQLNNGIKKRTERKGSVYDGFGDGVSR